MDGTVLDNEKQYGKAFKKVLNELGVDVDEEHPHTTGIGVKENWPKLIDKYDIDTDLTHEQLEEKTRKEYWEMFEEVGLQLGFEDFISSCRQMGYLCALATSNIWMTVEKVFDKFEISGYFDVVTTGEEVNEKKPNPSIFMLTAQKLGVDPEECIVFEDAPSGIEAAVAAGMSCVGVARDERIKSRLRSADMIIDDFSEITIDEVDSDL